MNQSREGREKGEGEKGEGEKGEGEKGEGGAGEAMFPAAEFERDFDTSTMNILNSGRDGYLDIILELNCCPIPFVTAFMSNPLHGNSKIKHDYRNFIASVGEAVATASRSSPRTKCSRCGLEIVIPGPASRHPQTEGC